ncbi:MAG: hypothetical protein M1815_001026, partial [Lichina confinis]
DRLYQLQAVPQPGAEPGAVREQSQQRQVHPAPEPPRRQALEPEHPDPARHRAAQLCTARAAHGQRQKVGDQDGRDDVQASSSGCV